MTNTYLKVSRQQDVNILELNLPDGLDSAAFDDLITQLHSIFVDDAGDAWVIDLTAVTYMGSSALGLLVNIRQKVKSAQGKLALCNLSSAMMQIFKTCCLERLFTITRSRDEAIRSVY